MVAQMVFVCFERDLALFECTVHGDGTGGLVE
jgi:hypothetical protein